MKTQDLKSKQIKKSIAIILGMIFLILGINSASIYVKYPAVILSISAFAFILYGFISQIITQFSTIKKSKINN